MASSIFTSMMRTMPSAAATTSSASGLAIARERRLGRGAVERHASAEKIVGGQIAEQQIAVGDRRRRAAAAVAGRTGHRAGALRADFEHAEAIDSGDGAAAGAHGVDVHHRHGEVAAFDLAAAGEDRLAVLDQRHVARGAAHVESDDVAESRLAAGGDAGGDAAGRPGQHRRHRFARGVGECRHAAVRLHDVFLPRGDAGAGEAAIEVGDVTREDRLQIGVDDRRARAGNIRGSAAGFPTTAKRCSPAIPRAQCRARAPRARDAGTRTTGTPRALRSFAP